MRLTPTHKVSNKTNQPLLYENSVTFEKNIVSVIIRWFEFDLTWQNMEYSIQSIV